MHGTLPVRQTYKTSEELGLTQKLFDSLVWFVDQCDRGVVIDLEDNFMVNGCGSLLTRPSMSFTHLNTDCGTAGCILGWITHRVSKDVYWTLPPTVERLFYGFPANVKAVDARNATVRVLRGEPAW